VGRVLAVVDMEGRTAMAAGRVTSEDDPAAAVAAELRRLLTEVPEHRERWLRHVQRRRHDGVSHSAVARVLSGVTDASLESLRDRARRALAGEVVTPLTIRLFSDAFELTVAEQERLWTLHTARRAGSAPLRPATGGVYEGEPTVTTLSRAIDVRVGADRVSWDVHTTITVQALADGVERFPLVHARDDIELTALSGCRLEPEPEPEPGTAALVHARFPRPLHTGDVHVYAYRMRFTAPAGDRDRYVAGVATPTAVLAVQVGFTPPALPVRVQWRSWRSMELAEEDVTAEQDVPLGPSHRVSWTRQDVAPGVIAGFEWSWV